MILKKQFYTTFIYILFFLSLLFCNLATAETVVPGGTISTDTTWNLAGSPYIISGNLEIRGGGYWQTATLTIEPGVVVYFSPGTGLTLGRCAGYACSRPYYGALNAQGTAANPITFTAHSTPSAPGDWNGISFSGPVNGGLTILDNCII